MIQVHGERVRGAVNAVPLANRATTQGKASPPGDVDTITSEWGEHYTIPIVTRLTSEGE